MTEQSPLPHFRELTARDYAYTLLPPIGWVGGFLLMASAADAGKMFPAAAAGAVHLLSCYALIDRATCRDQQRNGLPPIGHFRQLAQNKGLTKARALVAGIAIAGVSVGAFGAYVHQDLAQQKSAPVVTAAPLVVR
jgi:hypothetical protein